MMVGFDSCKCKGGMRFVITATYNKNYSMPFSHHAKNDSLFNVGPIGDMLLRCLQNFKDTNKIYPSRVIIFRKGTSESEKKLYELEINQILDLIRDHKINFNLHIFI